MEKGERRGWRGGGVCRSKKPRRTRCQMCEHGENKSMSFRLNQGEKLATKDRSSRELPELQPGACTRQQNSQAAVNIHVLGIYRVKL